jgi:hypothetical protein
MAVHTGEGAARRSDSSNAAAGAVVDRFLAGTGTPITSYRAFCTLEAETRGGRMRARLTAWTSLHPDRGFQYSIVEENGSGAIREKVLRAALEAERSMRASGEVGRAALNDDNYEFGTAHDVDAGLVQIGIHPKRHDTALVEGRILLTETDGDLVRVEGFLIKRPSIWTRQVEVVRRYARIDGVRVPLAMESTARVLMFGKSTFSMAYEYESINGRPVAWGGTASR